MFVLGSFAAAVGVAASLLWIAVAAHYFLHRAHAATLLDLPDSPPPGGWPKLSVVIAARDEGATIREAVTSLLAQDYPDFELIAVDDRSVDATGAILDELAAEDARLRVVHIADLPAGWLGKTNAMQRGADAADGVYILFTDGDVVFAPGTLRRAVALADREGLDHLTALPGVLSRTIGERIFLVLFALLMAVKTPIGSIARANRRAAIGVGAFNMVRASAFRDVGGFDRIRLSIDDDMRLGQALKFAGYRNKFVVGYGSAAVRWQVGLGGMVRGVEKNFFAALDFRPFVAVVVAMLVLAVSIGPMLGLFVGPWWTRAICVLGLGALAAMIQWTSGHGKEMGWWYVAVLPISGVVTVYALLRSMILTLRRRGVRWRGRLYSLAELKHHVKLRNHWLHEVWNSTR